MTLTLTDFLLARIAEDEAVARDASPGTPNWEFSESAWHSWDVRTVGEKSYQITIDSEGLSDSVIDHSAGAHVARHDPARVLAECEAKRRVIEECDDYDNPSEVLILADQILRHLALPYADHPDYREEWAA